MNRELTVYTGDDNLAPYDFNIETQVLATFNPTVFGLLLNANENQELKPGIIDSWKYDFKNHKYTLFLGNHKFHNGRKVTARDLEFSLIRGFISNQPNYSRVHFSDIKGISALKAGMHFKTGMVSGITVIDEKRIDIELENSNPMFLVNFTVPFVPLVPQEELEDDYFTWQKFPIGAGPYKILSDYKDHRVKLVASGEVGENSPKSIIIDNKRKNDNYDLIYDQVIPSELEKKYLTILSKYPVSISSFVFYKDNVRDRNINFRKAVYHAINRDELAIGSEQSKPAYEMMVRPYSGLIKAKNPFNLDLAKSFAKKLSKDELSKEIVVGVYSPDSNFSPRLKEVISKLSNQLSEVGFKTKFEANPEKFPTPEIMKKFSLKFWAKVVDLADPTISYGAMSSRSPYSNENPCEDGEFDRLYAKAVKAEDAEVRLHEIQNISKLIEDQALTVPLLEKYSLYRLNSERLNSLGDQPKPMFLDLSKVEMK